MPVLRAKQTGDMYVQVVVETPLNLTKQQRELLSEFDKLSSKETQPESDGFFAKVKEFLAVTQSGLTAMPRLDPGPPPFTDIGLQVTQSF